jgi:hypothetical protein
MPPEARGARIWYGPRRAGAAMGLDTDTSLVRIQPERAIGSAC